MGVLQLPPALRATSLREGGLNFSDIGLKNMSLPYLGKLIAPAKELRKNATRQEQHLWYDFLRNHRLRFQRQKVIGGVIVDFYCHAARLIIELDGSQHYEEAAKRYDEDRTKFLEANGLQVLRFPNAEVDQDFENVCRVIDEAVKHVQPRSGMSL